VGIDRVLSVQSAGEDVMCAHVGGGMDNACAWGFVHAYVCDCFVTVGLNVHVDECMCVCMQLGGCS
jgi:hypothetical protein